MTANKRNDIQELIDRASAQIQEMIATNPVLDDRLSLFKIRHFLLGAGTSPESQVKQGLIEIKTRIQTLKKLLLRERKLIIQQNQLNPSQLIQGERELKEIEYEELDLEIADLRQSIKNLTDEIRNIQSEVDNIYKSGPLKDEMGFWEDRFRRCYALAIATNGGPSLELVESILNLPESSILRTHIEKKLFAPNPPSTSLDIERPKSLNYLEDSPNEK